MPLHCAGARSRRRQFDWATGVAYARILNNHQRHGDLLKIATAADFCGTRWQNNAVIIPVPKGQGRAYLQPVARVMKLYRHHIGSDAISVKRTSDGLDIAASRTADTVLQSQCLTTKFTGPAPRTLTFDQNCGAGSGGTPVRCGN